eukprot:gene3381-6707_t
MSSVPNVVDTSIVFVGNLAWNTKAEDLSQFMATAGPLVSVDVKYFGNSTRSKGWGLVEYTNVDSAKRAVEILDSTELQGRFIHVRLDRSHMDATPGYTIYVGNLAWSVRDDKLMELFLQFNPTECQVMTNLSGRSRGFGLVKFSDGVKALEAMKFTNGVELDGRMIECRMNRERVRPPSHPKETSVVIASNLARTVNDEVLRGYFSQCGNVVSAVVQRSLARRSKGWGIIAYSTVAEAAGACELLNGSLLVENVISVRFDRK